MRVCRLCPEAVAGGPDATLCLAHRHERFAAGKRSGASTRLSGLSLVLRLLIVMTERATPHTLIDLAERFEVSTRTVRRYLQLLDDCGFTVTTSYREHDGVVMFSLQNQPLASQVLRRLSA